MELRLFFKDFNQPQKMEKSSVESELSVGWMRAEIDRDLLEDQYTSLRGV